LFIIKFNFEGKGLFHVLQLINDFLLLIIFSLLFLSSFNVSTIVKDFSFCFLAANVIAKLAKFPKGPPNDGKKEGKNDGGRIKGWGIVVKLLVFEAVSEKEFGGGINGIGKGKEVDNWKNGGGLLQKKFLW